MKARIGHLFMLFGLIWIVSAKLNEYDLLRAENEETNMFNCFKSIVEDEHLKNILILSKDEYITNNINIIFEVTTVKFYRKTADSKLAEGILEVKAMTYVMIVSNPQEVNEYLIELRKEKFFNGKLFFIAILLGEHSQEDVGKLSEIFISHKILNFLTFHHHRDRVHITTNFLYKNHACGKYIPMNDEVYGVCYQNGTFDLLVHFNYTEYHTSDRDSSKWFPSRIPLDLGQCEAKIVARWWPPYVIDIYRSFLPGIEIEFLDQAAKHMNLKTNYKFLINIGIGQKMENGSWDGVLGYIDRNEAEMAVGSMDCNQSRWGIFDESHWYLNNVVAWFVPLAQPKLPTEIIGFFIYESTTLAKSLFVTAFLAVVIIVVVTAKIQKAEEKKNFSQFFFVLLLVLEIFFGQSVKTLPRTSRARLVIGLWSLFCIFTIFMFHTSIISYFTSPAKGDQISTMDEIFTNKLDVTFDRLYENVVLKLKYGEYMAQINHPRSPIECLDLTAQGKAATVVDLLRARFISQQWLKEDGTIPLYRLENEPTYNYYVDLVMTKGHFLYEYVDEMVKRARESGYWTNRWKAYVAFRTVKCSVRRKKLIYAKIHGLNTSQAADWYNRAMFDAFPSGGGDLAQNTIIQLVSNTEDELIERFFVQTTDQISFEHLRPVFQFYGVGICVSFGAFLLEHLWCKLLISGNIPSKVHDFFEKHL